MKTINNRWANRKGFTLAELMLAVAIIIILGALAFVGVANYLRGLRLLEMDNAAREIFYAAQNRITAELNSGTLGRLNRTGEDNELSADATAAQNKGFKGNDNIDYAVVRSSINPTSNPADNLTLWNELLPFGSIDETLRSGGSYIITYSYNQDANLATVLDVWFASDERTGMFRNWSGSEEALLTATYEDLNGARTDNGKRRNFNNGTVIGYYGRDAITVGTIYNFTDLSFKLVNDEVLYGDFTFNVESMTTGNILDTLEPQLKITITEDNGAKLTLRYDAKNDKLYRVDSDAEVSTNIVKKVTTGSDIKYQIVLDNITDRTSEIGQRFRDLVATPDNDSADSFTLGKDIRVNVEVYSNKVLANINSVSAVDNSLFQYVNPEADNGKTQAGIGKIRHLQNLSNAVSGVELGDTGLDIDTALQTADLDWNKFINFDKVNATTIGGNIVYNVNDHTTNSFLPIDLAAPAAGENFSGSFLIYDAGYTGKDENGKDVHKNHAIKNLTVNDTTKIANAGLFGTVGTDANNPIQKDTNGNERYLLTVKNLDIEGATISGTATAGAVVANEVNAVRLENIEIKDVVSPNGTVTATTVTASSGNAGGAVGKAQNGLDLLGVRVSGTSAITATSGNAGGLIGEFAGTSKEVHIKIDYYQYPNDSTIYYSAAGDTNRSSVTVTGGNTSGSAAGGLVGAITRGYPQFGNSYSTAIVSGDIAGGLIGTIVECDSRSTISSCYVGGHTVNGKYDTAPGNCNVRSSSASGVAGGFIGSIGSTSANLSVNSSYTTASVSGDQAGGFIGSVGANTIVSNCYAVGLVQDKTPGTTPPGAFIGDVASGVQLDSSALAFNRYFELINGDMPAVAVEYGGLFLIRSAEENLETYNNFVQLGSDNEFSPYDPMLSTMFGTKYFLPTVSELSGDANAPSTHVGDWQPVDTLAYNTTN